MTVTKIINHLLEASIAGLALVFFIGIFMLCVIIFLPYSTQSIQSKSSFKTVFGLFDVKNPLQSSIYRQDILSMGVIKILIGVLTAPVAFVIYGMFSFGIDQLETLYPPVSKLYTAYLFGLLVMFFLVRYAPIVTINASSEKDVKLKVEKRQQFVVIEQHFRKYSILLIILIGVLADLYFFWNQTK